MLNKFPSLSDSNRYRQLNDSRTYGNGAAGSEGAASGDGGAAASLEREFSNGSGLSAGAGGGEDRSSLGSVVNNASNSSVMGSGGSTRKRSRNLSEGSGGLPAFAAAAAMSSKAVPDSHDYEPDESDVWRAHRARRARAERGAWWTVGRRVSLLRWLVTLGIGACTGLTAMLVTLSTGALTRLKFGAVRGVMEREGGPGVRALCAFCAFNVAYVAIANAMVVIEPLCAGSGIPDIKCFLNGINLLGVVKPKALVCKVVGIMFAVAGGLPAGKEGPMVHSGAVIAATISQGDACCSDSSSSQFQEFRNDREKRDFVASGAAAGVAAAFGAPIGGVLFSLEEGASFWSTRLTWRAFFCAMVTVFTLYVVKSSENLWGQQDLAKMFSFGEFGELTMGHGNYSVWELSLFVLLGCMGGLVGACFNHWNEKLTLWRQRHVSKHKQRRLLEAVSVAGLMSVVAFVMPLLWGRCSPKPVDMENWTSQEKRMVDELVSFNCDPHTEYNEVASLFFTDADTAIRQLFHFREGGERSTTNNFTFSSGALFLFWLPYTAMACITYGIAVPSGLFVPSLLSGAALGRLCGHLLHKLAGGNGALFADSGTYALIGAAAALGGMARMTISLTVILLEATGDMQYVLPLMLTLMAARWTGKDRVLDSSNLQVLAAFASAFHVLQPATAPAFAFAWLELVSHRMFMPTLLLARQQKGWMLMHRLLVDLLSFMEPRLRRAALGGAVRALYRGMLRVLLVLLHDFPEFLCEYHFSLCDVIPPSCIQLRNLVLSAFPRSMRLPDPFTPNLKVDLLPEISQPPRILSNYTAALVSSGISADLDKYLQTRGPAQFLVELPARLRLPAVDAARMGSQHNVQALSALVVYVGSQAIAQMQSKAANITHSAPMDVFQHLAAALDAEARYFFLNAVANQLRYPNNHTHYFSCVLLYLFAEAGAEDVREQITRILLERLIVHRPHPWGLLITFIELIKNPRYDFWSHRFTHCAPELERVFESVARSCMAPGGAPGGGGADGGVAHDGGGGADGALQQAM